MSSAPGVARTAIQETHPSSSERFSLTPSARRAARFMSKPGSALESIGRSWALCFWNSDVLPERLLKNGHLRRYPAASHARRRGKESLLIRRDATPHPSFLRGDYSELVEGGG